MKLLTKPLFSLLRCPACGGERGKSLLCEDCSRLLKKESSAQSSRHCIMCGQLIEDSHVVCGDCLITPRNWDYFYFYGYYKGLLKEMITEFKYSVLFCMLPILQDLLCEAFLKTSLEFLPDIIVPVPLHKNRLKKRGFNQSLEIAKKLSRTINVPIGKNVLIRTKDTPPQVGLGASQRAKNVKNAFVVKENVKSLDILLVDDVFTSGSTLCECAFSLKSKGAKKVGVAVVARAVI